MDPPYNTGSACGGVYDDLVEHSIWLSLMRDRVELLRRLLCEDGSLWMFLDDNEVHYMKVLCDEIFGRHNFVQTVVWQRRASPANDAKWLSNDHDYILVYANDKEQWRPIRLARTAERKFILRKPRQRSAGGMELLFTYTCNKSAEERPQSLLSIVNPHSGVEVWPKRTAVWRCGPDTHAENVARDVVYWGKDGRAETSPRLKRFLDAAQPVVPRSVWLHDEVGHTQAAMSESKVLFPKAPFPTPKTEAVISVSFGLLQRRRISLSTPSPGPAQAGAIAGKMGRRSIMIELGDHAVTHVVPRLQKVIDNDDPGGITGTTGWEGGGGSRFYGLAPSLLEKDKWDNSMVAKQYNSAQLVEAICKLHGFHYEPSPTIFWQHGRSTESDFLYVTTQSLLHEQLAALSAEVGSSRTLLVVCSAYRGKADAFDNLTVKKSRPPSWRPASGGTTTDTFFGGRSPRQGDRGPLAAGRGVEGRQRPEAPRGRAARRTTESVRALAARSGTIAKRPAPFAILPLSPAP